MSDDSDRGIREMLATLDPERMDPGYWPRFHRWVLNSAGAELTRRRRGADTTVSEVMFSWWRTLVPTAAAAVVLAGLFLLRGSASAPQPVASMGPVASTSVDEMLLDGMDVPVMPAFETADPEGGIVVVNEVN